MLLKDIALTDAQKAQVRVIREKYLPQQMELRKAAQATGTAPDEATRAKMMELQTKQAAKIRRVPHANKPARSSKNTAKRRART